MCALSHLLGVAATVGLAVGVLTGDGTYGWTAAGASALVLVAWSIIRGRGQSLRACGWTPSTASPVHGVSNRAVESDVEHRPSR